jgi:hypothetical protein
MGSHHADTNPVDARIKKSDKAKPEVQKAKEQQPIEQEGLDSPAASYDALSPASLRLVQRAYGNQFVQRLSKGMVISGQRAEGRHTAHRAGGDDSGGTVHPAVEETIESKRGGGQPLSNDTREQMEMGFGADFSGVRVHNDTASHDLSRTLNARAFTTKQDIFFGEDEYNPGSEGGQELIAHELTHVVQQGGASSPSPQTKMTVNEPGDEYEQEADSAAEIVMSQPAAQEENTPAKGLSLLSVQPDALSEVSLSTLGLSVQRADEEADEEKNKAEEKTNAAKGEAKEKSESKKSEMGGVEGEKKKGKGEEESGGKEEGPVAVAADVLAAGKQAAQPVKGPTSMKPPMEGQLTPAIEEGDIDQKQAESVEQGNEMMSSLGWAAQKPPDWDAQVAAQEIFLAILDPNEGPASEIVGTAEGAGDLGAQMKALQRQADGGGGGGAIVATSEEQDGSDGAQPGFKKSEIPDAPYELPTAGDSVGGRILDSFVVDPVAGTAVDIGNSFATLGKEPNAPALIAGLLEGIIKIMELVTNILSLVSLVLHLVGALLYAIGWALMGIGSSLMSNIFTLSVGISMFSWGITLQSWASTLLGWASTIDTLVIKITIIRAELRVLAIILRGLSLFALWVNGASIEEINKELTKMKNQAVGLAIDGATIAIGTYGKGTGGKKFGVPSAQPATAFQTGSAVAKALGKNLAANVAKTGLKTGWSYTKEEIGFKEDDEPAEEGEEEEIVLPPVPWDAVARVDSSTTNLTLIDGERQELLMRFAPSSPGGRPCLRSTPGQERTDSTWPSHRRY